MKKELIYRHKIGITLINQGLSRSYNGKLDYKSTIRVIPSCLINHIIINIMNIIMGDNDD